MTLDVRAQGMAHGEALLEAPIGELIYRVAASIAEAQLKLDQVGVRVASLLSETKVPFNREDGTPVDKSLLELGFLPPFYAFTETDIEVKMTLTLKVQEDDDLKTKVDVGASAAGSNEAKRVVPFAASISADYHRKFDFDMSGSSHVRTKLVSLPAPAVFLETLREHARALSASSETSPEPEPLPEPDPLAEPDPSPDPQPDPGSDPTG